MCTQIPGGDVAGIVEDVGDGSKVSAHCRLTWSCASMYELSSACDTNAYRKSAVLLLMHCYYLAVQERRPCIWLSSLVLDDVQRRHICTVC